MPVPRSSSERKPRSASALPDRRLDRFVGDVQFADAVPFRGMRAEIGLGSIRPRLPHGSQPLTVARKDGVGRIEAGNQRAGKLRARALLGQAEEGPGPLAKPRDQPGLGQQPEVAGDARLRLAQDLGQVGDREFGFGKQRQHAQPGPLARGPQGEMNGAERQLGRIGHVGLIPSHKDIFIPLNGE